MADLKNDYTNVPNHKGLFNELSKYQLMAIKSIAGAGLVDKQNFQKGIIIRSARRLPRELFKIIEYDKEQRTYVTDIILALSEIVLQGPNGLKARSELMEFRYDIV